MAIGGALGQFGKNISKGWKDLTGSLAKTDPMAATTPRLDPNQFITPVTVENPYEQELKKALPQSMAPDFTAAGKVGESQMSLAKALEGLLGTGSAGLQGLIGTLQKQQAGDFGPGGSLAQKILEQGLGQNIAGVRSQLASQRGLSPALAARYAAEQTAQLGGQTAQQAGILGLQQQLAAQQLLGSLSGTAAGLGSKAGDIYGTARTQEIEQAKAISDADLKRLNILASSDVGIRQLQAQTGMDERKLRATIAEANQAAAAGDMNRRNQLLGGLLGAAGQVGAAYATKGASTQAGGAGAAPITSYSGGRIPGEAPVSGDHPKNDIVPANLSPGEIVIPRSSAGSKKAAKSFIDSLDDWDEEPSYSKVLKARSQKKKYAEGGRVEDNDIEAEIQKKYVDDYRQRQLDQGFDVPIPGVGPAKAKLDEMLTSRVVEPMARAGYPTLGAAMATVPSTLAEALVPSTAADLAGTLLPLPGAKLGRGAAKQIKEGKAAQLLEQMAADDVDISKLPSLSEFKKISKEYKKQKVASESEKSFLRSREKKKEAAKTAVDVKQDIFGRSASQANEEFEYATDILEELAQDNLDNKNIAKAWNDYQTMSNAVPWGMAVQQNVRGRPMQNFEFQKRMNAYEISRQKLYEALKDNKKDLKLTDEMEKLKKVREFPLEKKNEYRLMHKAPTQSGAPLHDLTKNSVYPKDVYERPDFYWSSDDEKKAANIIMQYKNNPNAEITIYRAVPKGVDTINPGDWIALTKEYAEKHLEKDGKILVSKAKVKDLFNDGNSFAEFGYQGSKKLKGKD